MIREGGKIKIVVNEQLLGLNILSDLHQRAGFAKSDLQRELFFTPHFVSRLRDGAEKDGRVEEVALEEAQPAEDPLEPHE